MSSQNDNGRQALINNLCKYIQNKVPKEQIELVKKFAERYYAFAPLNDLLEYSMENLAGAFLSHWNFIYIRKPFECKIQVFNPTLEKDGWESKHTIIEVSHDDIPFLVDSMRMAVNRKDIQVHLAIHFGGLKVLRDEKHRITDILPSGGYNAKATTEAPIYFEIDRQNNPKILEDLKTELEHTLSDVRVSVYDWRKMLERAEESLLELEKNPPALDPAEITESKDFLRWLIDNHFTFLGCRDYKLIGNETNRALQIIPGSGLGVLREDNTVPVARTYADLPPQARKLALSKNILIIAKTKTRATVHRDTYTDYIGVKRFNERGELIGERRFIGLYTSTAYHSSPRHIPFLRHKVAKIMQDLHFPPDSHNGKEVIHILETLPRDDLFQATHEELSNLTLGILQLQERKRIRLFVRKDAYGRYFSCLVYVPREIFTTELSNTMQDILMSAFHGLESSFTTYFSDSVLARIHFHIRINPKKSVDYDADALEQKIIAAARSWSEEFKSELMHAFGDENGSKYFTKYRRAFPASYTEYYTPATAIHDIKIIEDLSPENPLGMNFYKSGKTELRLKLYHVSYTIALSDVLPTLENMGLRIVGERPHEIIFKDGNTIWINDFNMVYLKNKEIDIDAIVEKFKDAFANIWFENAEDDGFNRLVLGAELTWRETTILRAYTKYLRQIGFTFSQSYVELALVNNPMIAKDLVSLFLLRFSPEYRSDTSELVAKIEKSFDDVTSLDEDRILRRILEIILATTRTNYFQKNAENGFKSHISFKFDPAQISDLPLPRPMFEIFVYSPRVEGVHLRRGKVARGGIRWSDRREDFRTEILGLMKAQNVKNSVIVPVGAKGGFFPKTLPEGDRDAVMTEVIYCYSAFIRGLLDLTDNIVNQKIVPPPDVVRYDEDDPYLVVAADKGTATFSDLANAIAKTYNFWLDDAFASGGSAGYDHKKMGITARGAWESVKRHFRELDINPDTTDFTVVGIGDMSGDVFGNGMLMSSHIKLIGAFDHRHIFIDPNPDPQKSFQERKRLFALPRSSWMDYDVKLISEGGGIYNRSAKSIKISPELKKILNIKNDFLVPNELIRALMKSPVDLIFNGGIGTFVKASFETHLDVGDRTNDGIRVNGDELTARVVGEGGNLGLTQSARIEYSLNDGIIYTDFIDNSAGVDCSDHEVNIKILLNKVIKDRLMTLEERNQLLEAMTDEVGHLVLRDNYEQTQMLSLEASVATRTTDLFRRYMDEMEKHGRLDRTLEFLPDDKMIQERKAHELGLTRPEIAVMIAYCKLFLKQDILDSAVPEDPYFIKYLKLAFPAELHEKYLTQMKEHSLRREIIATQLAKSITDHMGVNFVERLQRETGASTDFIIRAFVISDEIFQMTDIWHQIEALDYQVQVTVQQRMILQVYFLIRRATRWFLRNRKPNISIEDTIATFKKPISELIEALPTLLTPDEKEYLDSEVHSLVIEGVPEPLAGRASICEILFTSLDMVEAAIKNNLSLEKIAQTYYILDGSLELNWIRTQMNSYSIENQWDELARSRFRDDLERAQSKLSVNVLKLKSKKVADKSLPEKVDAWLSQNKHLIDRWQNLLAEIKASNTVDFVTFSVVLRELADFAKT
jgi:glutamate dehydrogenase